jgi:putative redox protein
MPAATQERSWSTMAEPDPSVVPGTIVVAESKTGTYTQHLLDGKHVLVADEPAAVGGNDAGPNPYSLLLMALGSCTSITLRMFAKRWQWPLDRIIVRLRHSKIHAVDCADCDTKAAMLDHVDCEIELVGALDDTQRAKALDIAGKCPVHLTLTSQVDIATTLAARP